MLRAPALLLCLVPVLAAETGRAELPPVAARLDYSRGPGAEACPAEPVLLRAQVRARLGYDPFERSDARERVVVVVSAEKNAWSARIERYDAAGARTFGPETFPDPPLRGDCQALISPLAAYLRGMLLSGEPAPAPPTPSAPPPPTPLASTSPPQPELRDVPNPARVPATRVAMASFGAAGVFLGLGIAWTVDARNKRDTAESLGAQLNRSGGHSACAMMSEALARGCASLASALRVADTTEASRNAWYIGAGVTAAVGVTFTVLVLTMPRTSKGPPLPRLSVGPRGFLLQGTF